MSVSWFLDSADILAWREWLPAGLFFGVTTNPLLLARAGVPCTLDTLSALASEAFSLGVNEFHAQVWGETPSDMIEHGLDLSKLDARVVVKVPITREGVHVAAQLIDRDVRVTMTALYDAHQVATAMALGAAYAAPYLGRMNEAGRDGLGIVSTMQRMIDAVESPTRLLIASIRQAADIPALMPGGANTFTLAPSLLPSLFDDRLTLAAAEEFARAARVAGGAVSDLHNI
jgi:transaldolase